MYRRGPSKSTPANVQCQKCLKRARHYSYECKASAQERPYVSRPSRTQQLFNPKLMPKLTADVPDNLQKRKGLADQELAKREAERAKKRELEADDDDSDGGELPKRRRSASYDSVSSISTRRSPSPPPAKRFSASPPNASRGIRGGPSPVRHAPRRQSYGSASGHERRYSPSPPRRARNDSSPDRPRQGSRSPTRDISPVHSHRAARDEAPNQKSPHYSRRRRFSSSPSRSPPSHERQRYRSRSPDRPRRRGRSPPRNDNREANRDSAPNYGGGHNRREGAPPRREQRERSLSPFSKRLALTQAMNMGR